MNITCLLKGHEPLRLSAMGDLPLITVSETIWANALVHVEMCERCHLVYWVRAQPRVFLAPIAIDYILHGCDGAVSAGTTKGTLEETK